MRKNRSTICMTDGTDGTDGDGMDPIWEPGVALGGERNPGTYLVHWEDLGPRVTQPTARVPANFATALSAWDRPSH